MQFTYTAGGVPRICTTSITAGTTFITSIDFGFNDSRRKNL